MRVSSVELKELSKKILVNKGANKVSIKEWDSRFKEWATIWDEIQLIIGSNGHSYRLGLELEQEPIKVVVGPIENGNRLAKNSEGECSIRPKAELEILKAFNEFRVHRRYNKIMRITPWSFTGKWGKIFKEFVDQMENFRCVLAVPPNKFYSLLSEFLIDIHGRYYPIKSVLGNDPLNSMHEFWLKRITEVMSWISDVILSPEVDSIKKFMFELGSKKISTNDVVFKSKDWFCVHAIMLIGKKRGWTDDILLSKIEGYMRRKKKRKTPEMLLMEIVNGDFDRLEPETKKKEKKKRKETSSDVVKDQEWYEKWKKESPRGTTFRLE